MLIQDEKLIKLSDYLNTHAFDRQKVADYLGITTRQLTRLLKKWQAEGIIQYDMGSGRGITSSVTFLIDIEKEYVNQLLNRLQHLSLEEIRGIMALPLSQVSKDVLRSVMEDMVYKSSVLQPDTLPQHILIDYIYKVPETIDPVVISEVASATIVFNTMDRLYTFREGKIVNSLVIFDEWQGNDLIIHLHREVRFSNGHVMYANDVVKALNHLFTHKDHAYKFIDVISVEAIGTFTLKLQMTHQMHVIKYLLGDISASIYKKIDGTLYGTGAYFVHRHTDSVIHFNVNRYSLKPKPDIEEVILINDIDRYRNFYFRSSFREEVDTKAERIKFFLFNPESHASLNVRKSVAKLIAAFYDELLPVSRAEMIRLFDGIIEVLAEQPLHQPQQPLKFLYVNQQTDEYEKLIQYLNENGIATEGIPISFSDYVENDIAQYGADFALMFELVPSQFVFLHMLMNAKLKDYFLNQETSQHLQHVYKYCHEEYWPFVERNYREYLAKNHYIIPISTVYRNYYMREGYKNISVNDFGIVDYSGIITS